MNNNTTSISDLPTNNGEEPVKVIPDKINEIVDAKRLAEN